MAVMGMNALAAQLRARQVIADFLAETRIVAVDSYRVADAIIARLASLEPPILLGFPDEFKDEGDIEDEEDLEEDLSGCPYFRRHHQLEGHDPNGVCDRGCQEEPACITMEPAEGWPGHRA